MYISYKRIDKHGISTFPLHFRYIPLLIPPPTKTTPIKSVQDICNNYRIPTRGIKYQIYRLKYICTKNCKICYKQLQN